MVTEITILGLYILIANYALTFAILYAVRGGNVPDKRPQWNLRPLIIGRIVSAMLLMLLASSPRGEGLLSIVNVVADPLRSLGPYYFIISLALDMVAAMLFYILDYYKALAIVLGNLPCFPMVTAIASLVAMGEQIMAIRRVEEDTDTGITTHTAVLGTVSKIVATVEQLSLAHSAAAIKTHVLVRTIPGKIPVEYSPVVGDSERELNPHMIIAGSSGAGKTTTVFSLIIQLMKHYKVLLFDVKGDFTGAFYQRGAIDNGSAEVFIVSRTGLDPFKPLEGETELQMVEVLMDSISVLEEVGSKQAHFIRAAYAELRHSGESLTYENLLARLERVEREIMDGRLKYGPQTKDAVTGIYGKMYDLKTVFRSDGVSMSELYAPLFTKGNPRLVVLNIADINEKTRAIVLEFMLRKLAKIMEKRGPLAFTNRKPVVVVIDEAYLVTKPIQLKGGREAGSRSKLEDIARTARSYGVALILVTQRLNDIADGIRQSCYRWLIFNTSSPDDIRTLSEIAPKSISSIIPQLQHGEAYLRYLIRSRWEGFSQQDSTRIITDGYIINTSREKLGDQGETLTQIKVCHVCGRVLTSTGLCLGKHVKNPPQHLQTNQKSETKPNNAGNKEEKRIIDEQTEKPNRGNDEDLVAEALAARDVAVRNADEQTANVLKQASEDAVIKFCINWREEKHRQLFIENGLLTVGKNKVRKTVAGRLLLKHFEEITSGGD